MKRRGFLKGLVVAALAVALAPVIHTTPTGLTRFRMFGHFKISGELLDNTTNPQKYLQELISKQTPNGYKVKYFELGFNEDDFCKNLMLCRFELIKT